MDELKLLRAALNIAANIGRDDLQPGYRKLRAQFETDEGAAVWMAEQRLKIAIKQKELQ